jgi:predicted alpha/beta superfamily hydrolase
MRLLRFLIAIVFPLYVPSAPSPVALASRGSSSASPELRLHELRSRIFANTRTIRVLLPPGYDDSSNRARRYPVLYLNDGQNLFDASTSVFSGVEWQVDETMNRLLEQKRIVPLIVVGIDNAGRRARPGEYLPYPDEYLHPPVPSPQGKRYPDFIIDEVMPLINRTYRTQTGPQYTGIGGSSYGAVAALYVVMSRPGVFGRVLLESPSLYISNKQLLKESERSRRWPDRIYLAIGTRETGDASGDQEAVELVGRLSETLAKAGLNENRLLVVIDEGGTHREEDWGRRLSRALEFLYGNGHGSYRAAELAFAPEPAPQ